MYTCYIQSFKFLASFCSWAGWFEYTWSKIPEDTFSRDVAQTFPVIYMVNIESNGISLHKCSNTLANVFAKEKEKYSQYFT